MRVRWLRGALATNFALAVTGVSSLLGDLRRGGSVVITTFTTGVNGLRTSVRSLVIDLTADCDRYSTDICANYEATLERSRQPLSRVLEAWNY